MLIGAIVVWLSKKILSSGNVLKEYNQLFMAVAAIQYATQERDKNNKAVVTIKRSIEEKLKTQERTRKQGDKLAELVQNDILVEGQWQSSIEFICEEACRVLNADRVSVWSVSEDGSRLNCNALFDINRSSAQEMGSIDLKHIPVYFNALKNHSRINAEDAVNDNYTKELAGNYLIPFGIVSILDACIVKDGQVVGVVCVEQLKNKRTWQVDEENFVTVVAGLVAQLFFKKELLLAIDDLKLAKEEKGIILDNIPDAIATIEPNGTITRTNLVFEQTFQVIANEPIQPITSFLPAIGEINVRKLRGLNQTFEMAALRCSGEQFTAVVNIIELFNRKEQFLVVIRDISQQKEQEKQLIQSQKMEALGQLTGTVAHDFNNIISIIVGYGQLILPDVEGNIYDRVSQIVRAGERAKQLVKQLLVFSTKSIKKVEFFDINKLLDQSYHSLTQAADTASLQLETEGELIALLNKEQFETVLTNLVVNASHASIAGGEITISTEIVTTNALIGKLEPGIYVLLKVRDNGHGISEDVIATIFEPFVSTKGKQGTGLGLAQVQAYMKSVNGEVTCESEVGVGTVFNLYFPTSKNYEIKEDNNSGHAVVDAAILIVDDEVLLTNIFATQLKKLNFTIYTAQNLNEAVTIIENNQIDLVLTDIKMKNESGMELVRYIIDNKLNCKIQLMSGYSDEVGMNEKEKDLIDERLVKPFTPEELSDRVKEILSR